MRILLIEDDRRVASFIQHGLKAENYQVDIAHDGEQGTEMGVKETYDLLLLDINLPRKSGFDVCKQLRQQGLQSPVLMLTARDDVTDRVKGLEAGADDYLTKPFAFEELTARLRALLRRPKNIECETTYQVADLVLDNRTHEVMRANRSISVTPKEFTLLEYLMQRADRVLSRPMIEEHVWGYQQDPLTNVVDVYIRRLRQKMDRGYGKRLIHTIRGVGYKLKA